MARQLRLSATVVIWFLMNAASAATIENVYGEHGNQFAASTADADVAYQASLGGGFNDLLTCGCAADCGPCVNNQPNTAAPPRTMRSMLSLVPVPRAFWLLASALVGLVAIGRRRVRH